MGNPKYNAYPAEPSRYHRSKQKNQEQNQSINDKADIKAYIDAIKRKMNDPTLAKKAAQIIEEMIRQKK